MGRKSKFNTDLLMKIVQEYADSHLLDQVKITYVLIAEFATQMYQLDDIREYHFRRNGKVAKYIQSINQIKLKIQDENMNKIFQGSIEIFLSLSKSNQTKILKKLIDENRSLLLDLSKVKINSEISQNELSEIDNRVKHIEMTINKLQKQLYELHSYYRQIIDVDLQKRIAINDGVMSDPLYSLDVINNKLIANKNALVDINEIIVSYLNSIKEQNQPIQAENKIDFFNN